MDTAHLTPKPAMDDLELALKRSLCADEIARWLYRARTGNLDASLPTSHSTERMSDLRTLAETAVVMASDPALIAAADYYGAECEQAHLNATPIIEMALRERDPIVKRFSAGRLGFFRFLRGCYPPAAIFYKNLAAHDVAEKLHRRAARAAQGPSIRLIDGGREDQ